MTAVRKPRRGRYAAILEQAADLVALVEKKLPLLELTDNFLRLGSLLEESTPANSPELFELGTNLTEIAALIASARVKPDAKLIADLRKVLRFLARGTGAGWPAPKVKAHAQLLRKRLRETRPALGISDRRVLVIDDEPISQEAICGALRRAGFVTISALTGAAALKRLRVLRPSLIILDVEMPDIRGPRLLRMIRSDTRLVAVPVLFVSARKQLDVKLEALRSGADDYITKPFRPEELATRVAARLERGALLQEIALRDPLTGIATHRLFQEKLEEELARHSRYKSTFAVACIDIDDLAAINEKQGYDAGDRTVRRVGQLFGRAMRKADLVARLNGGEFGIIMPQTPIEGALTILDRLRLQLSKKTRENAAISLSGGVAGCPETTGDRRLLMAKAREALEIAKRRGKGRLVRAMNTSSPEVVVAEPDPGSAGVLEGMSTSEIRTLREVFVRDFSEHLRRLDQLDRSVSLRDRARAVGRLGHFLAGAGAIGGQPELGTMGEAIELSVDRLLAAGAPPAGTELALGEIHDAVQKMGAGIRAGGYHPSEAVSLEQRLRINLNASRNETDGTAATPGADVLVVDDEKVSQAAIGASLRRAGFSIRESYSAGEALEAVAAKVPDVIILDVALPDMDGHELLAKIRANAKLQLVPVIFVTAKRQLDDKIQALRTGADDYVTKPFSPEELVARISSRIERAQITRDLALRDGLTGVYNHRFFQERLEHELSRAKRYQKPFCLALIDVDDFKSVNDRHGHQTGDAVLRGLSSALVSGVRSTDIVARYGGEEFAVLLPETPIALAVETLDRVREQVGRELRVNAPSGDRVSVTFSGGVGEARDESKESLIHRVDSALYQSKRTGKNRFTVAESVSESGNSSARR